MKAARLIRAVAVGAAFVWAAAAAWGCVGGKTTATPSSPKLSYVAVVETEVDAQSGASAELNPAEVRQITAALRREAVENLPRGTYNIMTTETVQSMGGAVLEECSDENCVVTLGSKIGADYIVRGIISRFENKFTISVEMYETYNGMLVASSEYVRADGKAELMDKAVAASANMYRKFVNPQGAAVAARKGQQQTVTNQAVPTPPPPVVAQQPVVVEPKPAVAARPQPAPAVAVTPTPQPAPPQPINKEAAPSMDASGTIIDNRDGKEYRTVVIGGKRWMAENLNHQPQSGKSWCYKKDGSYCDKYGRLYDWSTARNVCMSGWHLPSRQEWNDLVEAAGGREAGKNLKARSGWSKNWAIKNGNGTDDYGFSALPGGGRGSIGGFGNAGYYGFWWTATEGGRGYAYTRNMYYYYGYVYESYDDKSYGFSVRCIQD